jgi:hypothetical protein
MAQKVSAAKFRITQRLLQFRITQIKICYKHIKTVNKVDNKKCVSSDTQISKENKEYGSPM